MWQQTREFFALGDRSQKESVLRTRHNPWGYYNNELTKNQRDKKEVFDYTVDGMSTPSTRPRTAGRTIRQRSFQGTMMERLPGCLHCAVALRILRA